MKKIIKQRVGHNAIDCKCCVFKGIKECGTVLTVMGLPDCSTGGYAIEDIPSESGCPTWELDMITFKLKCPHCELKTFVGTRWKCKDTMTCTLCKRVMQYPDITTVKKIFDDIIKRIES